MAAIELDLISHFTHSGLSYQHLHIHLNKPHIQLEDLRDLVLPAPIPKNQGVVLEGKVPLWLYGYLKQQCQQAPWIGCYEPRLLGAVIAIDRSQTMQVGEVVKLDLPAEALRKVEAPQIPEQLVAVMNAQLELQVTALQTKTQNCQTLAIDVFNRTDNSNESEALVSFLNEKSTLSNLVPPSVLAELELPTELDLTREVVLFGAGPSWLYVHLLERCHQAPWIASYDLRSRQAVVVQSRDKEHQVGDAVSLVFNKKPGISILVGGPPNSGKSVFSNALRCSILQSGRTKVYLHRANWDGEGNFAYETPLIFSKQLVQEHEIKLDQQDNAKQLIQEYFSYHAQAVKNARDVMDLMLVDVGGVPQKEKSPLVDQCTHYIVISRDPQKVQEWHDLCSPTLKPLAVIHSKQYPCFEILRTKPFLEIEAGPWEMGETKSVPDDVLQAVLGLFQITV